MVKFNKAIDYSKLVIYNKIMEKLTKSFIKKLYITFYIFILVGCKSNNKIPDDLSYMITKYPEISEIRSQFKERNLDPAKINIDKDLKGKMFPSFLQWDNRWAYLPYNGSIMAKEGNIPTALSSIYSHFKREKSMNPYQMGVYFEEKNWAIKNMGTSWNAIEKGSLSLGLKYKVISSTEIDMTNNLRQGKILLASVGKGDFTKDSGLIIIYGKDKDKFLISDPLSKINSQQVWEHETLNNQIIHIWAFSIQ